MRTHFTWCLEQCDQCCPTCKSKTVLVSPGLYWHVDYEADPEENEVELREEITGHFCLKCLKLTSLSLNT